jgi:predicted 3-demethylubiquinone-9 3-methyltransferase (glyoxalase superfamily)
MELMDMKRLDEVRIVQKPGDISSIDFELHGQQFTALYGGPLYTFSEAISIQVNCNTQEEIDRL